MKTTHPKIRRAGIAAAFLLAAVHSPAASILGDDYQVDGTFDIDVIGPVSLTADTSPVDLLNGSLGQLYISLHWVDENSFDISVQEASSTFDLALTLSGLQFKDASGAPVDITGASFNYADSVYATFLASPSNPSGSSRPGDPNVNFTANSVSVNFGSDWSGQLVADWPVLRFDVEAATIPEPGISAVSLLGCCILASRRRR